MVPAIPAGRQRRRCVAAGHQRFSDLPKRLDRATPASHRRRQRPSRRPKGSLRGRRASLRERHASRRARHARRQERHASLRQRQAPLRRRSGSLRRRHGTLRRPSAFIRRLTQPPGAASELSGGEELVAGADKGPSGDDTRPSRGRKGPPAGAKHRTGARWHHDILLPIRADDRDPRRLGRVPPRRVHRHDALHRRPPARGVRRARIRLVARIARQQLSHVLFAGDSDGLHGHPATTHRQSSQTGATANDQRSHVVCRTRRAASGTLDA